MILILLIIIKIYYERLLGNIGIKEYDNKLRLVFGKKTLTTLENVIYAHDAERKWIQNHPTILYEAFIVQNAIKTVKDYYKENSIDLFSQEALSVDGVESKGRKIRLLCDDDVIYVMKNELNNPLIDEYFDRRLRRHAIWKSEAEYRVIFDNINGSDWIKSFSKKLADMSRFLNEECDSPILNNVSLNTCEKKLKEVQEKKGINDYDQKKYIAAYNEKRQLLEAFKNIANKLNIDFDFVIVQADKFRTGFSKESLQNLLIDFPGFVKPRKLCTVTNLLNSLSNDEEKFYYIYYQRKEDRFIEISEFVRIIKEYISPLIDSDILG